MKKIRGFNQEFENFYWRSIYTLKVHEDKKNRRLCASFSFGGRQFEKEGESSGGVITLFVRIYFMFH